MNDDLCMAEQFMAAHMEEYLAVLTALERKFPDLSRDRLQQIIHLAAVASGDLTQRTAESLLTLATVCPSLKLS